MEKITSRKKLLLYGCSGMGVNMMSLMVGSYLCSALLTGGFDANVEFWTFMNRDLVLAEPLFDMGLFGGIATVWSLIILASKILDGIIDIPLSSFTDRLKTRWGRRRPSLLIGFIPMVIVYVLFLFPPLNGENIILNTVWFGVLLCIFYTFYTLTMLTFYATFPEVTEKEADTVFLSNVKSVCDIVYFTLGYALIPVFIGAGINIRFVALIFLPLSLLMLIPLFMLKEKSTKGDNAQPAEGAEEKEKELPPLKLGQSIACAFKNKTFIYWMFTTAVMNFGLQLFLGGINEIFSFLNLNMTIVMAFAFAPVPFTLILYNKLIKKYGLGLAYKYILLMFSIGMFVFFMCGMFSGSLNDVSRTIVGVLGGILASFSIGAFFSVGYTVPSHLAQVEFDKKGVSVSSMYFAVQGLFEGIAAGLATGPMLIFLKQGDGTNSYIGYLPIVVIIACVIAFAMSFGFSKTVSQMGKLPLPLSAMEQQPVEQQTNDNQ